MTSASSMNHEIIKKSIKKQSKQGADNGDIIDELHQAATNIFLPKNSLRPIIPPPPIPSRNKRLSSFSKHSFCFYAATSVVLALCYLTTPTNAYENITQPLPL